MFGRKKNFSIYSLIDNELERLYKELAGAQKAQNGANVRSYWATIEKFHDTILTALSKQPTSEEEIHDLQESVADLILLGDENDNT